MLSNAPGFLSLYAAREVHFEEVYRDILHRAYLPPLRGPLPPSQQRLLDNLQKAIGGEIVVEGEEFFLSGEQGKIEFTLLAEGFRKLGLLWLLIRNGSLADGSVLFWDEPETNLNPGLYGIVIKVLLELHRAGVQVFFATHDYVTLKELDLQMKEEDDVAFHSLFRDGDGEIACRTTHHYLDIRPNAIDEKFTDLYDREIMRSFGGGLR
ncbi:MAG: AAA family ATPase [Chloroflexota bacterium]|nr:AAA family ATPase [Chloroflexota bacterium]MDE2684391.1 AAA family ATPase [Chloroflexota bacterium]